MSIEATTTAATLPLHADTPPIRSEHGGTMRVGDSRISLDLIVELYENGATPEEMVRAYDTLVLADVYGALAYYLRHRDFVGAYLERRAAEAKAHKSKIESDRPRISPHDLLDRRAARETDHAPTGQ